MTDLRTTLTIVGRNKSKRAINGVRSDVRGLTREFGALKREAVALAGVTFGVAGLTQATRQTLDFGKALAEVSTLLDDTSQVDGLKRSVEELTRQYGGDVITNTRALYNIISAGAADSAEATEQLAAANRLAIGGVTDVATAADGLTSILNAYGPAVENAAAVSDALFVAMRAGKTTIAELSASIGQVAPLASTAGVSLEQLLAATAAITKGGVRTAEAMTQVRSVLAAVVKPTADAVKLAAELGIQFDLAAIRSKGFAGFLNEIRERTGGSEEQLAKLFGRIEALQGVLALTGNAAEDFGSILESMGDKAGQTAIAVEKMLDTPAARAERFAASLDAMQRSLGDIIVELAPVLEGLTALTDTIGDLEPETKALVGQFAGFVALLAGGRITAALVAYTAAQTKAAIDARRLSIATLEGLRAKEADALAARAAAVANLNMARAMDQATGGMARQAVAAKQVAAAHAAYVAAANATAAASRGVSLAAAAGRGALTLLGGPVGAITTALLLGVTAWAAYGDEAEAAAGDLESFSDTADRLLGNLDAINRRQIQAAIDLGESALAAIEQRIKVVSAALQSTRDEQRTVELRRELTELQKQEIEQGDKLVALRGKLASIGSDTQGGTGVTGGISTENNQLAELVKERDALVDELEKIDERLTAGPDPEDRTQAANIARLNTLRGQAGGALERGDTEGALQKMQEARTIIAALAESGETSTGYLQTQIRLVTELAGKISSEQLTPETDEQRAESSLEEYAKLRDEFLAQNPGKSLIDVDLAASQQLLAESIARLQQEAANNPIVVPVRPGGPGDLAQNLPRNAAGGLMSGPGTGTSDSFLSFVSNGEYLLKAAAVRHYGLAFLNRLNAMKVPKFASGGLVAASAPVAPVRSGAAGPTGSPIYFDLNGRQYTASIAGDQARDLRFAMRAELNRRGNT